MFFHTILSKFYKPLRVKISRNQQHVKYLNKLIGYHAMIKKSQTVHIFPPSDVWCEH